MSDIAIALTNVSKFYKLYNSPRDRLKEALNPFGKVYHKKFYALKNISLEVKKGEVLGIVGKNGSGKSTLLKLISGVLTPNDGELLVKGKISALLELGSGFNPEFTGMQNIYFYGSILGFSKREMDEKLDDILVFADIGDFINQPIKVYSSGMRARLSFSVVVHIEPEILILDEVLSVGDVLFQRKCYARMQEFFDSGKTIIFVSHNSNEINRLCTRAIFILDGKVVMDGEPRAVTKIYEKHLFSKKSNRLQISADIENIERIGDFDITDSNDGLDENNSQNDKSRSINEIPEIEEGYFVAEFISENTLEYDNSNLDIFDICIRTMSGKKVNNLITHNRYKYCYKLRFKKTYERVGFGMQIHSEKGIVVSSCGSKTCSPEQVLDHVEEGDVFEIEWVFTCLMFAGIYYTNTGVMCSVDGEREFINRITDALIFKVLPSKNCCSGLVSLQQSFPKVKRQGLP